MKSTMVDLGIAVGVLLVLASLLFRCGSICGERSRLAECSSLLAVAATIGWVLLIQGRLFLAEYFPLSNIIVLSNWLPLTTAFLAGVVYSREDIPAWRRQSVTLCLLAAGWLTVAWAIFPLTHITPLRRYVNGVCVQSMPQSCSACSSVTLLEHYGILADEAEMAKLCLTSGRGTQLLGIYRGLKLKTQGTAYQVQVVRCDYEQLLADNSFPILTPLKPEFEEFGVVRNWSGELRKWITQSLFRVDHCVVLYGPSHNQGMTVGDPSSVVHNPVWRPLDDVGRGWLGVGFRIVPKAESEVAPDRGPAR